MSLDDFAQERENEDTDLAEALVPAHRAGQRSAVEQGNGWRQLWRRDQHTGKALVPTKPLAARRPQGLDARETRRGARGGRAHWNAE